MFTFVHRSQRTDSFFHTEKNHKIFFQDPNTTNASAKIEYDGIPFIIERRKVFDCQHGIDRNLADKNRYLQKSEVRARKYILPQLLLYLKPRKKKIAASCARLHLIGKNHLQYAVFYEKLALVVLQSLRRTIPYTRKAFQFL